MNGVSYRLAGDEWRAFDEYIHQLMVRNASRKVCDVGGGANPIGVPATVADQVEYTLLDISESELAKAPESYRKVVADIAGTAKLGQGGFDLVFSKMLAEHVSDGRRLHANIFEMLAPGGMAVHLFPTLYAFPFLVNWMIPEALALSLLKKISPARMAAGRYDKFPAHYSWTFGPTRKQIERLESLGYEVVEYLGMFGHAGYYERVPPVRKLHMAQARWLVNHPIPALTSYARVTLRKPL